MRRVVVRGFDPMFRIGLFQVLVGDRVEFSEHGADLAPRLEAALPDVIVLDVADPDTPNAVATITGSYPSVRVITCTSVSHTMHVYPAHHHGEWFECPLAPAELERQVHD